jgi:hypothetical protein
MVQESQTMHSLDATVSERAQEAADEAVLAERPVLDAAFESGDASTIEGALHRVFRRVYLQGYLDGES